MRNFKLTLALFHLLCATELLAIVLARPTPVSSALRLDKSSLRSASSSSSAASARRRRLAQAGAVTADGDVNDDEAEAVVLASKSKKVADITLNAFDLCLCGAFATAFGDFVMHPVDTIKVTHPFPPSLRPRRVHTLSNRQLLITISGYAASGDLGGGHRHDSPEHLRQGRRLGFLPRRASVHDRRRPQVQPHLLLAICFFLSFDSVSPSCVPRGSGAIKFASFEVSKVFLEKRLPLKFHPAVQVRIPHPIPTLSIPSSLLISRCTVHS